MDALVGAILEGDRIDAADLLEAVRRARGTAAPGPDGWSGGYLRRAATLFPRLIAEIMRRDYQALSRSRDPLGVTVATEATVGGLAKPAGGNRPIVISRIVSRCILVHVTTRAREVLRKAMDASDRDMGVAGRQRRRREAPEAARCVGGTHGEHHGQVRRDERAER